MLKTSQFSPFHLCKFHVQVLLGKISLSETNRKHMCREYTGETVQEHVILGEMLFMWSCQRYQDFWLLAVYVLTGNSASTTMQAKAPTKYLHHPGLCIRLIVPFLHRFCAYSESPRGFILEKSTQMSLWKTKIWVPEPLSLESSDSCP